MGVCVHPAVESQSSVVQALASSQNRVEPNKHPWKESQNSSNVHTLLSLQTMATWLQLPLPRQISCVQASASSQLSPKKSQIPLLQKPWRHKSEVSQTIGALPHTQ